MNSAKIRCFSNGVVITSYASSAEGLCSTTNRVSSDAHRIQLEKEWENLLDSLVCGKTFVLVFG
eukprot:2520313-Rhodomonas_salina.1